MNRRKHPSLSRQGGRRGARRRVRTRTALFLCALSMLGMGLISLSGSMTGAAAGVWLGAAGSLAFFALPAYLGLCEIDGNQRHLLMYRRLAGGQALWLCAMGALLVCPATLLSDIVSSVLGMPQAQGTESLSLLMPMLLASGVIAPVCEELFFRGYLLGAFARYGAGGAALMTAALFALAHGMSVNLPAYLLLGLLFAVYALHTGSALASVLMHMAYNTTLILLAGSFLSPLFAGLTPLSCMLRLLGCAACFYAAKRAWVARGARVEETKPAALSRREMALLALALVLTAAAQIMTGGSGL